MTLHDTKNAQVSDLSTQFFLTESDVGSNRATACHQRLAELNTYVPVSTSTAPLTQDFLKAFRVVVLTGELPVLTTSLIAVPILQLISLINTGISFNLLKSWWKLLCADGDFHHFSLVLYTVCGKHETSVS